MAFSLIRFFILTIVFMATPQLAWAGIDQDYPAVKIQTLDKATARTNTIVVDVGKTVEFGSLFIKVQACRKSGPLDQPESAAFLQIWEVPINSDKSEWIFSGWMYASSPALSAMDHPVYDVWVLDCAGGEPKSAPKNNVRIKIDGVEVTDDEPEAKTDDDLIGDNVEEPSLRKNKEGSSDKVFENTINSVLEENDSADNQVPSVESINIQ